MGKEASARDEKVKTIFVIRTASSHQSVSSRDGLLRNLTIYGLYFAILLSQHHALPKRSISQAKQQDIDA